MEESKLASSFDVIPEDYYKYRSVYPDALFDTIEEELPPTGFKEYTALEVGCGFGQTTISIAKRVKKIIAVDPGAELLNHATRNLASFSTVEFRNAHLEETNLPLEAFDIGFSAQAFHWVEKQLRYRIVAGALKPEGVFAAFWARKMPDVCNELDDFLLKTWKEYLPDYKPEDSRELRKGCRLRPSRDSKIESLRTVAAKANMAAGYYLFSN